MANHTRIDPLNLQRAGLSDKNIEALRHVQSVVFEGDLDTSDIEKHVFSQNQGAVVSLKAEVDQLKKVVMSQNSDDCETLKSDIEQLKITVLSSGAKDYDALKHKVESLEMLALINGNPDVKQDNALLLSILNNVASRLDGIEAKLKDMEKLSWL